MTQDRDLGWLGYLAPPDEAELERQQATTYQPVPVPLLYHERLYPHPVDPDPRVGRCRSCGKAARWIRQHLTRYRNGREAMRPGRWVHHGA